jgi:hypothetical protein
VKTVWTAGLKEDEAKEVEAEFKASAHFRDRMSIIIRKKITEIEKHGRSEGLYSSPNWQLTQADTHGQIRTLEYLLSLIDRN